MNKIKKENMISAILYVRGCCTEAVDFECEIALIYTAGVILVESNKKQQIRICLFLSFGTLFIFTSTNSSATGLPLLPNDSVS